MSCCLALTRLPSETQGYFCTLLWTLDSYCTYSPCTALCSLSGLPNFTYWCMNKVVLFCPGLSILALYFFPLSLACAPLLYPWHILSTNLLLSSAHVIKNHTFSWAYIWNFIPPAHPCKNVYIGFHLSFQICSAL